MMLPHALQAMRCPRSTARSTTGEIMGPVLELELGLGLAVRQGAACALSGGMPTDTDRCYFAHALADATKGTATSS